jgi:hypothetical protein
MWTAWAVVIVTAARWCGLRQACQLGSLGPLPAVIQQSVAGLQLLLINAGRFQLPSQGTSTGVVVSTSTSTG